MGGQAPGFPQALIKMYNCNLILALTSVCLVALAGWTAARPDACEGMTLVFHNGSFGCHAVTDTGLVRFGTLDDCLNECDRQHYKALGDSRRRLQMEANRAGEMPKGATFMAKKEPPPPVSCFEHWKSYQTQFDSCKSVSVSPGFKCTLRNQRDEGAPMTWYSGNNDPYNNKYEIVSTTASMAVCNAETSTALTCEQPWIGTSEGKTLEMCAPPSVYGDLYPSCEMTCPPLYGDIVTCKNKEFYPGKSDCVTPKPSTGCPTSAAEYMTCGEGYSPKLWQQVGVCRNRCILDAA